MASFPEPLGFSESLEEYVARCGLGFDNCGCNLRGEYRDSPDKMRLVDHSDECSIGVAYGMWKERGKRVWDLIKNSLQPVEVTTTSSGIGPEFDILAEEKADRRGRDAPRNSGRNRV